MTQPRAGLLAAGPLDANGVTFAWICAFPTQPKTLSWIKHIGEYNMEEQQSANYPNHESNRGKVSSREKLPVHPRPTSSMLPEVRSTQLCGAANAAGPCDPEAQSQSAIAARDALEYPSRSRVHSSPTSSRAFNRPTAP